MRSAMNNVVFPAAVMVSAYWGYCGAEKKCDASVIASLAGGIFLIAVSTAVRITNLFDAVLFVDPKEKNVLPKMLGVEEPSSSTPLSLMGMRVLVKLSVGAE